MFAPSLFITLLFFAGALDPAVASRVREVKIEGNVRVPTATILRLLSTNPTTSYSPDAAQADLKKLHSLGLFSSLELETSETPAGIDVLFRVVELPLVSDFALEGVENSMARKILSRLREEKLEPRSGTPFRPALAKKAAVRVRAYLQASKFPQAEVTVREEDHGSTVRIILQIETGPRLEVGHVSFKGNNILSDRELLRQMEKTRVAPFWGRWSSTGAYLPEGLSNDLERLRKYYQSQGHATVELGQPEVVVQKLGSPWWFAGSEDKQRLAIRIPVTEGPRFQIASIGIEGHARECSAQVSALTGALDVPQPYNYFLLEGTRRKVLALLGQSGYALAEVQMDQAVDRDHKTVEVVYKIAPGDKMWVSDIRFEGNLKLREKFLRRELALQEGDLFDSSKLDRSIERLNRSHLLHTLQRSDVDLQADKTAGTLGIVFKVKEKQRQGIYATGGAAGGGYLGMLYTGFNLLGLGDALSMEIDGGAAQSNVLLDLAARHFLGSPFVLALSAFHRYTRVNVASIVPDAQDLVKVFRRRSTGFGLSGGYPITPAAQFNLSFRTERVSVLSDGEANAVPARSYAKSELAPAFIFDTRKGTEMRGSRLSLGHSWLGKPFLQSVDAVRPSIQYSRYADGGFSTGRSAFAFQIQASTLRSLKNKAFARDTLAYPGEELVRGFQRGSLSPWAYVPDQPASLQPAGADTVIGFSSEYRAPLYGPLGYASFVDLGWAHLDRPDESIGKGARLIEKTNGALRSSVGAELRLQLPLIRQPARLIFAWNPLRLRGFLEEPASTPLRLLDPRGSIRLALGGIF
jgi:outer membrane protein insertion porin family